MLEEEKMEEKRKKDKEEIQKMFADVERRQAEEREADRERKRERARRAKKAGPEAIWKGKYSRKLFGRENIPGALSKAPPCNPSILYFLRHVRFTHNTRLSCCTCHCFSLFKYLVVRTP